MSGRPRPLAWPVWVVGLVLAVPATVALLVWAQSATARTAVLVQSMALGAVGLVGLLLSRRRPENSMGWLFLGLWVYNGLFSVITAWAEHQALFEPRYTGQTLATWAVNWAWVPLFGCVVLYPLLLFPTGRALSPRWRPLVPVGAVVITLWTVAFAFQGSQYADPFGDELSPNPYGFEGPFFDAMPYALALVFVGLTFAALWCLVLRYRRGDDVIRAQLKWCVVAGFFWVPVLLFQGDHGNGGLIDVWVGVALAALPVAMGVAILRYRLYDIDRIISRTASYALVTGVLLVTYAVIVTSVTRLLPSSDTLAVAAATLTAAALARPLYQRVQHAVDRRFNRARYQAERTVDAFGARLRNEVDAAIVARDLTGVVSRTLQPSGVSLWVRGGA